MVTKPKIPELIDKINLVLERSRGALSDDEVQAFTQTVMVLKKFEEADSDEIRSNSELIAVFLLRFFSKPEIIEQIAEWFKHLNH